MDILTLSQQEPLRTSMNFNAQKMMQWTKVLHSKLLMKRGEKVMEWSISQPRRTYVIHVDKQKCHIVEGMQDEW